MLSSQLTYVDDLESIKKEFGQLLLFSTEEQLPEDSLLFKDKARANLQMYSFDFLAAYNIKSSENLVDALEDPPVAQNREKLIEEILPMQAWHNVLQCKTVAESVSSSIQLYFMEYKMPPGDIWTRKDPERERLRYKRGRIKWELEEGIKERPHCKKFFYQSYLIESLNAFLRLQPLAVAREGGRESDGAKYEGRELVLLATMLLNTGRIRFISPEDRQKMTEICGEESAWNKKTKNGEELLRGGYACKDGVIYIDPNLAPPNIAALLIHEMSHLLRDRLGRIPDNLSPASQIVLEETLGTIAAGYFQRSLLNSKERIKDQNRSYVKGKERELKFYDRKGIFQEVYDFLAPDTNISLYEFLTRTFLTSGFEAPSRNVENKVFDIYNVIAKGYLGKKITREQKRELAPDNLSIEISQISQILQEEGLKLVPTGPGMELPDFSVNKVYFIDAEKRKFFPVNALEVLRNLKSIHEKIEAGPSAQCLKFSQNLKEGKVPEGFIGRCDGAHHGTGGINPGTGGINPGTGGINPLIEVEYFCREVKL